MSKERRVMTEFLQLYKEFTCLWDTTQFQYHNKEVRDKAYDILLEKYRELHEEASILEVKKRIEYMRTTYRREQKKVLRSRYSDIEEYCPKLWYYELLSFLNDVSVPNIKLESTPKSSGGEASMNLECPKPKKRKIALSAVYLPEEQDENFSEDEDEVYTPREEDSMISTENQLAEAEAFGTTIGLQLKELDPMQRVFAEKLISDAIFQARLQKLNENSAIVTNYDRNVGHSF